MASSRLIWIESISLQAPFSTKYCIQCEPYPAISGLKIPLFILVIPFPLHIPPGLTVSNTNSSSFSHKSGNGVILASGIVSTISSMLILSEHALSVTVIE